MNILVYGAGVIGSYLAHVLCGGGHSVSVLARGRRREELEEKGLVIRHYLQRKTTADRPRVVSRLDPAEKYDAVFAVMQYQQMGAILGDLAAADSPLVVLVGNNAAPAEMERVIREKSPSPKSVLFGFQGTGGRRENGGVICVRFGAAHLSCGGASGGTDAEAKAALERIFRDTEYKPLWQDRMDAWYLSHLALILPVAYGCYAAGCDLTKTRGADRKRMLEAVREGFALLRAQGTPVLPQGEEAYFEPGAKRALMAAMLCVAFKTPVGRLAASDHCRAAVSEMEALDGAFSAVRAKTPGFAMPAWDALKRAMPDWETVRAQYAPPAGK